MSETAPTPHARAVEEVVAAIEAAGLRIVALPEVTSQPWVDAPPEDGDVTSYPRDYIEHKFSPVREVAHDPNPAPEPEPVPAEPGEVWAQDPGTALDGPQRDLLARLDTRPQMWLRVLTGVGPFWPVNPLHRWLQTLYQRGYVELHSESIGSSRNVWARRAQSRGGTS